MLLAFLTLLTAVATAQESNVKSFTPRGLTPSVEQVRIEFAQPRVKFGDAAATAPAQSSCFDSKNGEGRWIDTRNWVFDFKDKLPGGQECRVQVGAQEYKFNTGGPKVREIFPQTHREIDPEANFLIFIDGSVNLKNLAGSLYFVVDGLGDRIPAEILSESDAKAVFASAKKEYQYDQKSFIGTYVVVKSSRPFAPKSRISLVWSKDITAANGLRSASDSVFEYTVVDQFKATFSCQREGEGRPCIPLLPMDVIFNERIHLKEARRIQLKTPDGKILEPNGLQDDSSRDFTSGVNFQGPFKPSAEYELILPSGLRDETGRALSNESQFPLKIKTGENPALLKFAAEFGVIEAQPQAALPLTVRRLETPLTAELMGLRGKLTAAEFPRIIQALVDVNREPVSEKAWKVWGDRKSEKIRIPSQAVGAEAQVVGIPLPGSGFYVAEMRSPILGESLLNKKNAVFVKAAALVTQMAVHLKYSNHETWVWVTDLQNGKPVAQASVQIFDLNGQVVARAQTDAKGLALISFPQDLASFPISRNGYFYGGFFAMAEKGDDFSFTYSNWNQGIEPWRFQIPSGHGSRDLISHAILDRTLFKPGEKLSAKLLMRESSSGTGLKIPKLARLPKTLELQHDSGLQSFKIPLKWDAAKGSSHFAFELPVGIKRGRWTLSFPGEATWDLPSFSVESFRVPLIQAKISSPESRFIAQKNIPLQVSGQYFAGGPVTDLAVKLRWSVEPGHFEPQDSDLQEYQFLNGAVEEGLFREGEEEGARHIPQSGLENLKLGKTGEATTQIKELRYGAGLQRLRAEMEYKDPSGEIKSALRSWSLYPSNVILGIKAQRWSATQDQLAFEVQALDVDQKPLMNQSVTIELYTSRYYSHRKRLVGGFYAYEDFRENKKIGELCRGLTNEKGYFLCKASSPVSGSLIAQVGTRDREGNMVFARVEQWVVKKGEQQWFGSQDNDRIDLLPFKKSYEPGETAELQLRSPFLKSQVLITVEREKVLHTEVIEVSGENPVIRVPIKKEYAPNVVISAYTVRGRMGEPQATALVDLAKPSFKLGMAAIKVGLRENTLKVTVSTPKKSYQVRDKVPVQIKVTDSSGQPAKKGEITLIAVDEGLLELRGNDSWNLLSAMLRPRAHEVHTATAQSFVVGKRHFGLKAVPVGGDGGGGTRRELFDTLLFWKASVSLDAQGEARVQIPLNDSTTSFRIVAVAVQGAEQFGTGWTSVQSTQDVMILPGLAGIARVTDEFQAGFTVRNASSQPQDMTLQLETKPAQELKSLKISLKPGQAQEVFWKVKIPDTDRMEYIIKALGPQGRTLDEVKKVQQILPLRESRIFQAEMGQWPDLKALELKQPAGALPGKSRIEIEVSKKWGGNQKGLQEFWKSYPYSCLEQQVSRAVGLDDKKLWARSMSEIVTYFDSSGLLKYFPSATALGSVNLTAYVLNLSRESGFKISEDDEQRMLGALESYAEGRIGDPSRSTKMDELLKKITAFETLSRYGRLNKALLSKVDSSGMATWPLYTLTEWYQIYLREKLLSQRDQKIGAIENELRSRFYFSARRLQLRNEEREEMSWLMRDANTALARLVLATAEQPTWKLDQLRLVQGLLARQKEGSWGLTTANAWGRLMLKKLESRQDVTLGSFSAALEGAKVTHAWNTSAIGTLSLPWNKASGKVEFLQEGSGQPFISVYAKASVPVQKPVLSGFQIEKSVIPVEQKRKGAFSVGDIVRVRLKVKTSAEQSWVAVDDPLPSGASLLENSAATAVERKEENIRFYFAWFPSSEQTIEYSMRLNTAGSFVLPVTRIEAMYSPDLYSELPESKWVVQE